MKPYTSASILFSLALLGAGPVHAATTATTDPVGFVSVTVPATSDAVLAVPLNRTPDFKGVIQSIAGNVITVAGTSPGWATSPMKYVQSLPSQPNTYAVLIATGAKEGMTAKITANGANTVTIQLDAGDDLTGVKTEAVDGVGLGDHIDIMPYWTPSTLVSSTAGVGVQILGFVSSTAGINVAPAQSYAHAGNGLWEDDYTSEPAENTPLRFGIAFILRNKSISPLPVTFVGSVPMTLHRLQLATLANNTSQDIRFGYASPIPENLNDVGLGSAADGDQILGYNNSAPGYYKAPTINLVMDGGVWLDAYTQEPPVEPFQFQPGFGYVYRKFKTPTPSTTVWVDLPSYLSP